MNEKSERQEKTKFVVRMPVKYGGLQLINVFQKEERI